MAELNGLLQGIKIAFTHALFPLVVEGDSALILNLANKLQNGTSSSKISYCWILAYDLQQFPELLAQLASINFQKVKRQSNSLADKISNWGDRSSMFLQNCTIDEILDSQLRHVCELTSSKYITPDVGVIQSKVEANMAPPSHGQPTAINGP